MVQKPSIYEHLMDQPAASMRTAIPRLPPAEGAYRQLTGRRMRSGDPQATAAGSGKPARAQCTPQGDL